MARLASIECAGFFATPLSVIPRILKHIEFTGLHAHQGVILDPCCGDGVAVKALADGLNARYADKGMLEHKLRKEHPYRDALDLSGEWTIKGIELDEVRAEQAKELLGAKSVFHAALEQMTLVGDSKVDIVFLNPPYDSVGGRRIEPRFVELVADYLKAQGIMILIVPENLVGDGKYASELRRVMKWKFRRGFVWRFPRPEYDPFKQVVVFAQPGKSGSYGRGETEGPRGTLGEFTCNPNQHHYQDYYKVMNVSKWERSKEISLARMAEEPPAKSFFEDVSATRELYHIIGEPSVGATDMQPLMPMGDPHGAMVAASGALNGLEIRTDEGKNLVVRGSTFKVVVKETSTETSTEGKKIKIEREAEMLVARLAMLNLETGEIDVTDSHNDQVRFERLLVRHARAFVDTAHALFPPVLTPAQARYWEKPISKVRAPRALKDRDNGLFGPQVLRVAGVLEAWKHLQCVTLDGEQSCGKTVMSLAAAAIVAQRRRPGSRHIVVMLPPKADLVDKWAEEAKRALSLFENPDGTMGPLVFKIGLGEKKRRPIGQLKEAFAGQGLTVILLKSTTAKLGSGWEHLPLRYRKSIEAIYRNLEEPPENIDLSTAAIRLQEDGRWKLIRYQWAITCPLCFGELDPSELETGRNRKCPNCGEPLWQHIAKNGRPRWPLARYIRDHFPNRYVLIIDEAHQAKSACSAISYAATDLTVSAYKMLQMTATLFGGKASSIFHILYRTVPSFRALYGYNEVQKFINDYGLWERIKKWYPQYRGTTFSGYKEYARSPSEIPGVAPGMVMQLLPNTAFISLDDLDYEMPGYEEHTLFVEPCGKLEKAVVSYLERCARCAVEKAKDGNFSPMGEYRQARIGVMNRPLDVDRIADGEVIYHPPDLPDSYIFQKEEALLRLVQDAKLRGRKVLCFVGQIERRDPTTRLLGLLKRFGMRGVVMRANVKKRVRFLERAVTQGADVVFCSPGLVSVGLDLDMFATAIWYSPDYNVYKMPQANRRLYRLSQELDVEVYYLAYDRFHPAAAFAYIAEKVAAQQALRGDIRSGLARILGKATFVTRLQDATVGDLEVLDSDMNLDDLPELVVPPPPMPREAKTEELEPVTYEQVEVSGGATQFTFAF